MKRRLLTLLLTLVFCVTSVAPGFAMNADDLGGAVPAAAAVTKLQNPLTAKKQLPSASPSPHSTTPSSYPYVKALKKKQKN